MMTAKETAEGRDRIPPFQVPERISRFRNIGKAQPHPFGDRRPLVRMRRGWSMLKIGWLATGAAQSDFGRSPLKDGRGRHLDRARRSLPRRSPGLRDSCARGVIIAEGRTLSAAHFPPTSAKAPRPHVRGRRSLVAAFSDS